MDCFFLDTYLPVIFFWAEYVVLTRLRCLFMSFFRGLDVDRCKVLPRVRTSRDNILFVFCFSSFYFVSCLHLILFALLCVAFLCFALLVFVKLARTVCQLHLFAAHRPPEVFHVEYDHFFVPSKLNHFKNYKQVSSTVWVPL